MNELDVKREKFASKLNIAVAVTVTVIAGLIAFAAAGMAIVVGSTVIAALAVVNMVPVASRKLAIWKFKALKQTAIDNPIETMEIESQTQAEEIQKYQDAFTARQAQGTAFIQEMAELAKDDPEGAAMYADQIQDYHTEMEQRAEELREAVQDHEEYKKNLELFRRRWRAAQASAVFNAGKPDEKEKILRNILVDEAMNAVRVKANESAARLKTNTIVSQARSDFKKGKQTSTQVVQESLGLNPSPTLIVDIKAKEVQPQK